MNSRIPHPFQLIKSHFDALVKIKYESFELLTSLQNFKWKDQAHGKSFLKILEKIVEADESKLPEKTSILRFWFANFDALEECAVVELEELAEVDTSISEWSDHGWVIGIAVRGNDEDVLDDVFAEKLEDRVEDVPLLSVEFRVGRLYNNTDGVQAVNPVAVLVFEQVFD